MVLLPATKMNKIMTSEEESYGFAYFHQKYINQNLKAFTDAFTSILASFVNQCVLFLFDLNKKILFFVLICCRVGTIVHHKGTSDFTSQALAFYCTTTEVIQE